jgi:hypothetical protein
MYLRFVTADLRSVVFTRQNKIYTYRGYYYVNNRFVCAVRYIEKGINIAERFLSYHFNLGVTAFASIKQETWKISR